VSNIVLHSVNTAREIVALMIAGGEGAFLQKISIRIRNTVRGIDYHALAQHADSLVADAAEYERLVGRYRKPVKNGWSGRTKQRAVYLGGTHVRLTEMAQLCRKVMRHKAGLEPLIPLEFKRAKQEFI
jgi:hypothetical protein